MLDKFLRRARQRLLVNRSLSSLLFGAAVFLTGVLVALVAGTAVLGFWIPLALGLGVAAILVARAIVTAPDLLQIARLTDQKCSLSDTLSTAFHFREHTSDLAAAQRRQAEQSAQGTDLRHTFPAQLKRPSSINAGLAVLLIAVCGLRLGVLHRLDLRAPLAQWNFDPFNEAARAQQRADSARKTRAPSSDANARQDLISRLGTATPDGQHNSADPEQTGGSSGVEKGKTQSGAPGTPANKEAAAEGTPPGSEPNANAPKTGNDSSPSSQDGAPQSAQAGAKTAGSPDSSGLLSKLRDAMSSLISKMNPQGGQSAGDGKSSPQGQQPGGKQQASGNGQKGDSQDQKGAQGDQDQSPSESDQIASGQGAGKTGDGNASAKPGSGMGHQDGDKGIKDAEQLAAMGKLSEIIGKRSATLTGEMTIESQSGPQQLKTEYTHSGAKHGEASGDVNRDEVPVPLQAYVQNYFEEVRKQAAQKKIISR